jgi:PleD family two-component response regulator
MIDHPYRPPPERPQRYFDTMPVADPLLDPITGFLNRKAGLRAAAILVAESSTSHTPLGAIWVDIDRFRQVNE